MPFTCYWMLAYCTWSEPQYIFGAKVLFIVNLSLRKTNIGFFSLRVPGAWSQIACHLKVTVTLKVMTSFRYLGTTKLVHIELMPQDHRTPKSVAILFLSSVTLKVQHNTLVREVYISGPCREQDTNIIACTINGFNQ